MRRPKRSECEDEEEYDEAMGIYADEERDREIEEYFQRQEDIGDQIHQQRKDEQDD